MAFTAFSNFDGCLDFKPELRIDMDQVRIRLVGVVIEPGQSCEGFSQQVRNYARKVVALYNLAQGRDAQSMEIRIDGGNQQLRVIQNFFKLFDRKISG